MLKHHQKAPEGGKRDRLFSADGFASESEAEWWRGHFLPCEVLCCLLLTSSNGQGTVLSMVYSLSIWLVHPIDVFSALAPKLWPSTVWDVVLARPIKPSYCLLPEQCQSAIQEPKNSWKCFGWSVSREGVSRGSRKRKLGARQTRNVIACFLQAVCDVSRRAIGTRPSARLCLCDNMQTLCTVARRCTLSTLGQNRSDVCL